MDEAKAGAEGQELVINPTPAQRDLRNAARAARLAQAIAEREKAGKNDAKLERLKREHARRSNARR